ncbi:MAG: bifunctional transaldolase/phosoglucose isomerase [Deltaproteobacteria bacterium]|nr:bifunctional transaldolase/phosoglucose isomerase [Deltaproteobacteria bacterium]
MNPLLRLIEYGQSYWLDNLTRSMIKGGELKRRVNEEGLRGVTSNPAIFHKAISGSPDYDAQIKELVAEGLQIHEIYERLVVTDIRDACDVMRPVYDESDGKDGFVSLEVSPYLAHDTEETMAEARRLFKAVGRPNVLIKIPGTPAGVPAIEEMLYEGININVTLLFSLRSYEAVAEAYLKALERRAAEGKPVHDIASVASFFLSRIDVLADQLLGHRIRQRTARSEGPRPEQLFGRFAVANARLAYRSYKNIIAGERWKALETKGARVQRLLWASTSTKSPLYRDVYYVEPLIGPDTVNTMPDETIDAFTDHGKIIENSVELEIEDSREVLVNLKEVGVDPDFITQQLQNEGVQKFIDPFDKLMQALAEKREKFLGQKFGRQSIAAGKAHSIITSGLDALNNLQFGRRVSALDPFLWTAEPETAETIRKRLGWLKSIDMFCGKVDEITGFAAEIKGADIRHVVLLGMGGSSLCPEVCVGTFGSAPGRPRLLILDNTDPAAVRRVESRIDLARTLFIVASKSGTTTETHSFYTYFYGLVKSRVGGGAGEQFVAITDPGTPLTHEARAKGFRRCFENPEDIGGRYSALSYFGLVPMALIGIDIGQMLDRALQMQYSCGPYAPAQANPGVHLGTVIGLLHQKGRNKATFVLSKSIDAFGSWAEQLLAESTGKGGLGIVPVESEPLGSPEVYNHDRVFVHMRVADDDEGENEQKLATLEKAGHPVVRIELGGTINLGAEFFRWELATATAGAILGINPFDEPNVAESKKNTGDLLSEWKEKGTFPQSNPALEGNGIAIYCDSEQGWLKKIRHNSVADFLASFIALAQSPDYIALLPYFLRTSERHEALQAIRVKLRDRLKVATTIGYGPRYLHSTGQLHKGGPNTGLFLMFTADEAENIPIPDQPYDFATLQRAQALGDFRSLNGKQRRVIRVHLGSDVEYGLKEVVKSLS